MGHKGPDSSQFFILSYKEVPTFPEQSVSTVQTVRTAYSLPTSENIYGVKRRAEDFLCSTSYNVLLDTIKLLCLHLQSQC